jgi:hypothetical protein
VGHEPAEVALAAVTVGAWNDDDPVAHVQGRSLDLVALGLLAYLLDDSHPLVARYHREGYLHVALVEVHIGPADAAELHFHEDAVVLDLGLGVVHDFYLSNVFQNGGFNHGKWVG